MSYFRGCSGDGNLKYECISWNSSPLTQIQMKTELRGESEISSSPSHPLDTSLLHLACTPRLGRPAVIFMVTWHSELSAAPRALDGSELAESGGELAESWEGSSRLQFLQARLSSCREQSVAWNPGSSCRSWGGALKTSDCGSAGRVWRRG